MSTRSLTIAECFPVLPPFLSSLRTRDVNHRNWRIPCDGFLFDLDFAKHQEGSVLLCLRRRRLEVNQSCQKLRFRRSSSPATLSLTYVLDRNPFLTMVTGEEWTWIGCHA
ncbi:hypothetical protein NL676_006091 [Syzygium grande]|nr:hypothetical protein NL676_006091 [Syzygium grande]